MNNPFLRPLDFYKRRVEPISDYVKYMGFYVSKMKDISHKEAAVLISDNIKNKKFNMRNPRVIHYERDENDDQFKTATPLTKYIKDTKDKNYVLAPTFTCFLSQAERPSQLVGYTTENKNKRAYHKKLAKLAKDSGDMLTFTIENNNQDNKKRNNNSLSGTFVADGTVLQNKAAHSVLTSITRLVSSLGNASNEKIITGNRHYFNAEVTLNNLIFIAAEAKEDEILPLVAKYKLHIPTVEETMGCVTYSTDLYWMDPVYTKKIKDFILKLKDYERIAIVYGGDLYHIRVHNPLFMRAFIDDLSRKVEPSDTPSREAMVAELYSFDGQIPNYGHQICIQELAGSGTDYSDTEKYPDETLKLIWATCKNIHNTVLKYQDFIHGFLLTSNIPASVANLPTSLRRSVVASDTDATMFSIDEWVKWYFGELVFTPEAFAVSGAVMFVAVQCIAHALAVFSTNMNVARDKIFLLAMKPEYMFPVFALTSVAKHYYTCILVKEGSVYKDIEMEIKGVHLKNSAVPALLNNKAHELMQSLLRTVMKGEKISLKEVVTNVADVERLIFNSLMKGETKFFKTNKIKQPTAYSKGPAESPYKWHTFWNLIFANKYGELQEPPYSVIKIPTILVNKTSLQKWIDSIEDSKMKSDLDFYCKANNRANMPTVYISIDYISSFGIPKEIKKIINHKKIILDLTKSFRIVLETLGFFCKKDMLLTEQGY